MAKDFSNFSNPSSWFLGQSVHYVNGIVFGLMFALLAYNKLPTFVRKGKSLQKGLVFGVTIQTIISLGFLFPYVYAAKPASACSASAKTRSARTPSTGSCPSPCSCGI